MSYASDQAAPKSRFAEALNSARRFGRNVGSKLDELLMITPADKARRQADRPSALTFVLIAAGFVAVVALLLLGGTAGW